jgi:hypothetical protein
MRIRIPNTDVNILFFFVFSQIQTAGGQAAALHRGGRRRERTRGLWASRWASI